MTSIYEIFLYRCEKEDATEITLMMLFFYLLGHMPPMSFKVVIFESVCRTSGYCCSLKCLFCFFFVFLFRQIFQ